VTITGLSSIPLVGFLVGVAWVAQDIASKPHSPRIENLPGDIGGGVPKPNINQDLIKKLAAGAAALAAAADADRLAQDIISKDRKGSINKVFPDQFRNKTLREIENAARTDKAAKTALKLLRDGRFKK
jgi:hypothetical protein